jgi:hypothetical protein
METEYLEDEYLELVPPPEPRRREPRDTRGLWRRVLRLVAS